MGNHRSRSKGCITCVARRVKCDERHPICARCENGGFSCEGFREMTFVDASEQVKKRFATDSKTSPISSASVVPSSQTRPARYEKSLIPIIDQMSTWHVAQSMQLSVLLPRSPTPSLPQDDVEVVYIVDKLLKGPLAIMYSNALPFDPSSSPSDQSMMNDCLMAMAKVFYGFHERQTRVMQDGLRLYGRGLRTLRDTLSNPDCRITTEMIVSVFALCVGESIAPTSQSSWMTHIMGLERLFALKGSHMTESSATFDRLLLEACRPLLIIAAFFTKKPSLMCQPEWRISLVPQPRDLVGMPPDFQTFDGVSELSILMGLLTELPGLYIQRNTCIELSKGTPWPQDPISILWDRINQLQQELKAWKEMWESNHRGDVLQTLSTLEDAVPNLAWATVFQFTNVDLANTFTIYHTVVILLADIPTSLLKAGLGDPASVHELSDLGYVDKGHQLLQEVVTSIRSICRSLEYYIRFLPPWQAPADFYLFFPIYVARRSLNRLGDSSELVWLSNVTEMMKSKFPTGLWVTMEFPDQPNGLQNSLFD